MESAEDYGEEISVASCLPPTYPQPSRNELLTSSLPRPGDPLSILRIQERQDPQVSWEELAAGGMDVHELPVYFGGMLVEPFVSSLAEQLKTCLDQV